LLAIGFQILHNPAVFVQSEECEALLIKARLWMLFPEAESKESVAAAGRDRLADLRSLQGGIVLSNGQKVCVKW
jgi:hypothetical protein